MGVSVGVGAGSDAGKFFEVRRASGPRRAMPQHAFFCGFTRELLADKMRFVRLLAERAGFVVNAVCRQSVCVNGDVRAWMSRY